LTLDKICVMYRILNERGIVLKLLNTAAKKGLAMRTFLNSIALVALAAASLVSTPAFANPAITEKNPVIVKVEYNCLKHGSGRQLLRKDVYYESGSGYSRWTEISCGEEIRIEKIQSYESPKLPDISTISNGPKQTALQACSSGYIVLVKENDSRKLTPESCVSL
jgi:hypothetical protein